MLHFGRFRLNLHGAVPTHQLGLGTRKHLVRKTSWLGLKCRFCSPRSHLEMIQNVPTDLKCESLLISMTVTCYWSSISSSNVSVVYRNTELLTLCPDDWAARTMCYDGIVYLDGKRQKCPLTIGGFCEKRSCFPASFLSCFLRKNDLLPRCWYLRSQFKKIKIKKYPCTCGLSLELKKMFPQCAVFLQQDPTDGHRWRCF